MREYACTVRHAVHQFALHATADKSVIFRFLSAFIALHMFVVVKSNLAVFIPWLCVNQVKPYRGTPSHASLEGAFP